MLLCVSLNAQNNTFSQELERIQTLRVKSKNVDLDLDQRIAYAKQASALSYKTKVDTVIVNSNNDLINTYLEKRAYKKAKKLSFKNLELARKIKDSFAIADAHFFIGEFYRYSFIDSAYHHYSKAEEFYRHKKNRYKLAKILYGIATVQRNEKDLVGSEITSIQIFSILNELKQTNDVNKLKSFTYNNLGVVFDELEQFEESIKYFNKSLELKSELKGDFERNIGITQNNLIKVYKRSKHYNKAIEQFNQIKFNNNLISIYPDFYAMALDNYAHTLYLKNKEHKELPKLYLKALKVSDSIYTRYESIIIHQHLAEYYNHNSQKDSALYHAYKAKEISEKHTKDEILTSLLTLSKIEVDSIAVKHYAAYVALNDSIQHQERLKRNKFARIQFETDHHIKETERLSTQNGLILAIASVLILILGLLYFIRVQRSKNKELIYQSEQEHANQELYKLMLSQQTKLEEGRLYERHRIAEELHDGILSRLFGTRMGMGFLNVEGDKETLTSYNQFLNEMQGIEQEIRDVSHELKSDVLFSKSSFETIVEQYIKTQSKIGDFKYSINTNNIVFKDLNEVIRLDVYRIIQEAIQNIIKHANAKNVTLNFVKKENVLVITIKDDGIGFNNRTKYKGIGLKNMNSRVLKIEGTFTIQSKPSQGTQITINIPTNII